MIPYILKGLTLGFAAAIQPGPFQTYLISQSLKNGWRRGLPLAFVPLFSDLPIIALVLLVLNGLPPSGILILRIVGGAFLMYLAYGAFRTALAAGDAAPADTHPTTVGFFRAVMVNFLNPNPYLFWGLVSGPILITGWQENPAFAVSMLSVFYAVMIAFMAILAFAFGLAGGWNPRVRRALLFLSALALACFGMFQLAQGGMAIASL